ncbi:MAG: PAS domain-containing protein [Treponema sp.]|jgi:predicted transcriptional regulator YheO|nr:PAS domain-containing protein [Treponema sp.]
METKNSTGAVAFTKKDKQTLESMKTIADGVAAFLGENCEVVLHSFDSLDKSIFHIVNGQVTGRNVGAPLTDLGMKLFTESSNSNKDVTECYYSKNADGKLLRSITILIRNSEGKPIGMMCINFDMDAPFVDVLRLFCAKGQPEMDKPPETFVNSIEELIEVTLREARIAVNGDNNIPNNVKNKAIVGELIKKGIFDIRGAIDIVALKLSVSRYTIYNYIRENKFFA